MEFNNDRMNDLLNEVIENRLEEINTLDLHDDLEAYKQAVETVSELLNAKLKQDQFELDHILKEAQFDSDEDQRLAENEEKKKQRRWEFWGKIGVFLGEVAVTGLLVWHGDVWRKRGMIFSETGHYHDPVDHKFLEEKIPQIFHSKTK